MIRVSRTAAVLAALAVVIVALHGAAQLGLRGPTGISGAEMETWVMDPISAVATVLRWVALVLSYYLAVVVVALSLAGDRLEASPARVFIPQGIASVVGLLIGATAVAVPLIGHMSTETPVATASSPDHLRLTVIEGQLRLHPLVEAPTTPDSHVEHAPTKPSASLDHAGQIRETWTVEPGDSFWKIAEEELSESWGRDDLTDAEVAQYWRTLIAENEDRLVEPGNPDLLFPGQELTLPSVPPAPR